MTAKVSHGHHRFAVRAIDKWRAFEGSASDFVCPAAGALPAIGASLFHEPPPLM